MLSLEKVEKIEKSKAYRVSRSICEAISGKKIKNVILSVSEESLTQGNSKKYSIRDCHVPRIKYGAKDKTKLTFKIPCNDRIIEGSIRKAQRPKISKNFLKTLSFEERVG